MKWRLIIPPKIQEILRPLPLQTKRYIRHAFLAISQNPKDGKPLRDELVGLYAFRVKHFRVVYEIHEPTDTLRIVGVGPRKTIYEDLAAAREED